MDTAARAVRFTRRALFQALVVPAAGLAVGCTMPVSQPYSLKTDSGPTGAAPAASAQPAAKLQVAAGAPAGSLTRSQAPENPGPAAPGGPVAPAGPIVIPAQAVAAATPPAQTTVPASATVPADGPAGASLRPPVVNANLPGPDQATTQIRVSALIGSDVVITDDEVWQMVRQRPEMTELSRLAGTERDGREKELFHEELRKLIERELVLSDFLTKIRKQKPKVLDELKEQTEKTAADQLRAYRKEKGNMTEAMFTQMLKSQGLSYKGIMRQLEKNAMLNIYMSQFFKDKDKAKSINQVQLARYYEQHPELFKIEDKVKWLDLFVSHHRFNTPDDARKYAEWLLTQAQGGADFVALVKEHGHGDSKLRGGDGIGTKPGEIAPRELEPIVFALTAGQVSGLVPTPNGLHIVKVLERQVAGVKPFDAKVQVEVRARMAADLNKAEYEKLIEELWRRTTVQVIE